MSEVLLDCANCHHGHVCCTGFRVPLEPNEVDKYEYDPTLARGGSYILQRTPDGYCVYLDRRNKLCKIWLTRPKTCRRYDCRNDERLIALRTDGTFPPETRYTGKVRVLVSVAVLNAEDKRKTSPMMIFTDEGQRAVEVVEVMGNPVDALKQAVQHIVITATEEMANLAVNHPEPTVPECDNEG